MSKSKKFILSTTFTAAAVGGLVALIGPKRLVNAGVKTAVRTLSWVDGRNGQVLQDKKIAVLLAEGFEDTEATEPVAYLEDRGADVVLAAQAPGKYTGKRGGELEAEHSVDQISAGDFDGLLIPGGYAPNKLRQDERVLSLVRDFYDAGKPIAAICHGPQVLIDAGLMEGKKATGYAAIQAELEGAGANYADVQVVQDGNLIMSRQPLDIPVFVRTFTDALQS